MSKRGYLRSEEKERYWRDVLRRHGKSGQKVREFCRTEGLKESAFYFWKRTVAERDREKRGGKPARAKRHARSKQNRKSASPAAMFMPLKVVGETSRLEIVAPDGWQVRVPGGVDIQTLFDVVAVLRQASGEETA